MCGVIEVQNGEHLELRNFGELSEFQLIVQYQSVFYVVLKLINFCEFEDHLSSKERWLVTDTYRSYFALEIDRSRTIINKDINKFMIDLNSLKKFLKIELSVLADRGELELEVLLACERSIEECIFESRLLRRLNLYIIWDV